MALGSTQPLTEMSTRSITGGKCGQCLEPSGPLQACNGTALPVRLQWWSCDKKQWSWLASGRL